MALQNMAFCDSAAEGRLLMPLVYQEHWAVGLGSGGSQLVEKTAVGNLPAVSFMYGAPPVPSSFPCLQSPQGQGRSPTGQECSLSLWRQRGYCE